MPQTSREPNIGVLDYHKPSPRQWPSIIRRLIDAGPWWIVPSWRSVLLVVLVGGAILALRDRPAAWTLSQQYLITPSGYPDYNAMYRPMPLHDAVFCVDANGCPVIWQPWTHQTLLKLPPIANFSMAHGAYNWLGISRDERRLLAGTSRGLLLLWDASNGMLLHQLTGGKSPYLPESDLDGYVNIYFAALSADGNMLATLGENRDADEELVTWDIGGLVARRLARRPLSQQVYLSDNAVEFSPDGKHLLLPTRFGATLFDSETLGADCSIPIFDKRDFQWLHAGKELIIGDGRRGSHVSIYDCQTGQSLAYPPEQSGSNRIAVSPDEKTALVADHSMQPCFLVDLDSSAVRPVPTGLPEWGCATFFPDGRRLILSSGDGYQPSIVDSASGSMLASLPLPPPPKGGWLSYPPTVGLVVSADGQHVAAQMNPGRVAVYDHTGIESRYGLMGSPYFAAMVALILAAGLSLWQDAGRHSSSLKRSRAAPGMVIFSLAPLVILCGWLGITNSRDVPSHYPEWPIILFALWLPAGLCIRAGSKGWSVIGVLLLLLSGLTALLAVIGERQFTQAPCHVFDRVMVLSGWQLFPIFVAALGASAALLILLLAERAPARSRWW